MVITHVRKKFPFETQPVRGERKAMAKFVWNFFFWSKLETLGYYVLGNFVHFFQYRKDFLN